MNYTSPRGTVDFFGEEVKKWQYIEEKLSNLSKRFNYREIRTPMFEHTEIYQRGVGDSTDIVQKEMYTFYDRGGRSLTLRPEGTAGVVRSFVQNKMHGDPNQPVKMYYFTELFRYERPEQGRVRQLHQFGVEVLGSADPAIDAEVISLAMAAYEEFGLSDSIKLVINSLGDRESRANHRKALIEHFTPYKEELCSDCQVRLEQNPMRILDCKVDSEHEALKTAPSILDYLNDESAKYFEQVKKYLDNLGIKYVIDSNLVRGLDYYNHTAFEIMLDKEGFGAATTLLGGGRYDGLTEQLGGPNVPGVGFGMGLERLLLALEVEKIDLPIDDQIDCFIVTLGDQAKDEGVKIAYQLRRAGLSVDLDYLGRQMRAQFRAADRFKAKYTLILGDNELSKGVINIRNMATGDQKEVSLDNVVNHLQQKMQGGLA